MLKFRAFFTKSDIIMRKILMNRFRKCTCLSCLVKLLTRLNFECPLENSEIYKTSSKTFSLEQILPDFGYVAEKRFCIIWGKFQVGTIFSWLTSFSTGLTLFWKIPIDILVTKMAQRPTITQDLVLLSNVAD